MPPLKSSKCKSVRLTAVFLTIIAHVFSCVLIPHAFAADIEAVLDTNDGSTGFVVQDSDNLNQTRIDSDGNLVTSGNVAIGTTTPAGRLIIQGDEVRIGSGGTIDYADGDGDVYIQSDMEIDRYLYGNRIFAANNIGIGTTSPQARMQLIGGDFLLGSGTFDNPSADPDLYIQGNLEVDGSVWLGNAIADNITIVGTMTQTGTTRQDGPMIVDDDNAEALLIRKDNDLGDILIVDTTNSQVELYNALGIGKTPDSGRELDVLGDIAVSGTSALTGNVGIGTAGPRALLEIGTGGTVNNVGAGDVYITNDLEVDGTIYGNVTGTINAALTPGAVAFGDSDGSITEDPGQLSFDNTNNRLGVGTSSPQAVLEIIESGTVPFMISDGVGGEGDLLTVISTGNVGLTTTSPRTLLEIGTGGTIDNAGAGDVYIQNDLEVDGTIYGTFTGGMSVNADLELNGNMVESNASGIRFDSDDNGVADHIFSPLGFVGLGTTAPSNRLEVVGGDVIIGLGTFTNPSSNADLYVSGTLEVDGAVYLGNATADNITIMGTLTQSGAGLQEGTFTIDETDVEALLVRQDSDNKDIFIVDTTNSQVELYDALGIGKTPDSGRELDVLGDLAISGTSALTGNVGIGTAGPRALLEIGTGGTVDSVGANDVYIANDLEVDGTIYGAISGTISQSADLELNGFMIESAAGGVNVDADDDGSADLGINPAGNLGIGTFEATANLEVVRSGASAAPLMISATDTGDGDLFIVNPAGRVGIGTASPTDALNVTSGDVRVGIGTFNNASSAPDLYVQGNLEVDGSIYLGDATADNITVTGTLTQSGAGVQEGNFTIDETDVEALLVRQDGDNKDIFIVDTTNSQVELYDALGIGKTPDSGRELDVSGDLAVSGTSALTGNVGIGTAGPRALLEIGTGGTVDSVGANDVYIANDLEVDGTIYGTVSGTISQSADLELNGFMIESTTGGVNIDADDDGNADLGINPAGNLGIGTFEATANLEIVQSGASAAPLMISATDTGDGDVFIVNPAGRVGIGTVSPTDALNVTSGDVRVGIGTFDNASSAPDLYVQGNLEVDGNIYLGDATADNITVTGTLTQSGAGVQEGTLTIDETDPEAFLVRQDSDNKDIFIVDTTNSQVELYDAVGIGKTPDSGRELDVSGDLAVSGTSALTGNVGIGTAGPRALLEIGTGGTVDSVGANDVYIANDLEVDGTIYGNVSGSISQTADLEMNGFMIESASGGVIFDSDDDGNADVTFEETGNVGIGTINPVSVFQVAGGDLRVGLGTFDNPSANFDIYTTGNLEVDGIVYGDGSGLTNLSAGSFIENAAGDTRIRTEAAADEDAIRFDTDGAERIVIAPSGNTGIGTASPAALLEIIEAGASPFMISNGVGGFGNHVIVTNQGNVGIGTNSPVTALHVRRDNALGPVFIERDTVSTNAARNTVNLLATSSGNMTDGFGPAMAFSIQDDADTIQTLAHVAAARDGADNSGAIRFFTNVGGVSAEKMRLSAVGNLGLGTSLPAGALTVMSGNVGIGTWSPRVGLEIGSAGSIDNASGNDALYVAGDIEADGTIYGTFSGDGSSLTGVAAAGGWTDDGLRVRLTAQDNLVGIGTTQNAAGTKLAVFAGNVGIGTWNAVNLLQVGTGTPDVAAAGDAYIVGDLEVDGELELDGALDADGAADFSGGLTNSAGELLVSGGNVQLNDSIVLSLGSGDDFTMTHDGTNTILNNTFATGATRFQLGTDDNATAVQVLNDSGDVLVDVQGDGNVGIGTITPVGALAVMSGNVGIGTWSPTAALEVVGTVTATAFTGDGSGLTGVGAAGGWTDDGTQVRMSTQSDLVGIGTTSNTVGTKLAVYAGNVGIGTWNAVNLLQVGTGTPDVAAAGDAYIVGDLEVDGELELDGALDADGAADFSGGLTNSAGELLVSGGNVQLNDSIVLSLGSGDDFTMTHDGTNTILNNTFATGATRFQLGTDDNATAVQVLNDSGDVLVDMQGDGNVGIGTITPVGGLAVMNGNVGIGTWSPTEALEVIGTVTATAFVGDGSGLTGVSSGWTDDGTAVRLSTATDNVGIGTTMPVGGLAVMANVGIGTWSPVATLEVDGTVATKPSTTADITALGGIQALKMIMRVQGDGGAIEVSANPQIASGVDGQMLILQGDSDANTVKLNDGNGVALQNAVSFTLGQGDTMTLIYDDGDGVWYEVGRTDN